MQGRWIVIATAIPNPSAAPSRWLKDTAESNRYFFRYSNVAFSRNNSQCSDETCSVACGKQLLRVGAIPSTAHFNGTIELYRLICPSSDFAVPTRSPTAFALAVYIAFSIAIANPFDSSRNLT
jgi:hypothetical protein